jgi:soluble cytochrome b562
MIKPYHPRIASALLLTTLLAAPLVTHAQDDHPKSPLSQEMSGIAHDIRALHKIVSDPAQKDATVKLVKDMEDHATKAKGFEPEKTKDIPAADKDQFIADYKKQMDGLIADFQKLEADITSGNTTDATAMLDKLNQDKREGHKKFNADNHGPGGPGGGGWGGPGGPSGPGDHAQPPPMTTGS